MTCPSRFDVGVYLLGALDPAERARCEEHLRTCAECAAELQRLGGLPGLLSRVTWPGPAEGAGPGRGDPPVPEALEALEALEAPDVPDGLLDGVALRVRRARRTRRLLVAAGAVVLLAVGVLTGWSLAPRTTATAGADVAAPVRTVALASPDDAPVRGEAGLTDRPWGTSITLRCRSLGGGYPAPPGAPRAVYVLTVRGPDGTEQQVARWSPPPGADVDVQAATNLQPSAVTGLQVRTGTGQLVLTN